MAVDIYSYNSEYEKCDETGTSPLINPIKTTHDGILGETREKKLYVGNDDDADHYYTNIKISFDGTIPSTWIMKLKAGEIQPTEAEWDAISSLNEISISDITVPEFYRPFWYRMEVPSGSLAQNLQSITLKLSYKEEAV